MHTETKKAVCKRNTILSSAWKDFLSKVFLGSVRLYAKAAVKQYLSHYVPLMRVSALWKQQ